MASRGNFLGFWYTPGKGKFMLVGASVVVRARVTAGWFFKKDYRFCEHDTGILQWKRNEKEMCSWNPFVTWDADPEKKPREILIEYLEVVGLQVEDCRLSVGHIAGLSKTR